VIVACLLCADGFRGDVSCTDSAVMAQVQRGLTRSPLRLRMIRDEAAEAPRHACNASGGTICGERHQASDRACIAAGRRKRQRSHWQSFIGVGGPAAYAALSRRL
jgi:hypothetical protein